MIRCRNQQNRNDHFCSICERQMKHNESYWRDAVADIVCDECKQVSQGLKRIETSLGTALCSGANPCGAVAHYDHGAANPWRINDDWYGESYATLEEAIDSAKNWSSN